MKTKCQILRLGSIAVSIFCSTALLFLASKVIASEDKCAPLFDTNNTSMLLYQDTKFEAVDLSDLPKATNPTVVTQGIGKMQDGSVLLFLNKNGESWNSAYSPAPKNPQGDPRWFPMLFGAEVGYHFGFRKIYNDTMTAPTPEFMNHRITDINKTLAERGVEEIIMRFHRTSPKAEEGIEYLSNILRESSLPVAISGHYAVHDVAYHLSSILMPKSILDYIKLNIKIVFRYKAKIDKDATLSPIEKEIVNYSFSLLLNNIVRNIDFATGNIGVIFKQEQIEKSGGKVTDSKEIEDKIDNLTLFPIRDIGEFISNPYQLAQAAFNILEQSGALLRQIPNKSKNEVAALNARSRENVKKFIDELVESEKSKIEALETPISAVELIAFVKTRINAIKDILSE